MKNWTKAGTACLLLTGLFTAASAQTDFSASSSGANAGPSAPRTGLYPGAINGAADNTVDSYTKRGTLIDGKQYFAAFGGAQLANGAYAFQAIGYDWFGSVTTAIGPGNGNFRSGIATKKWAAGLLLNFDKTDTKDATGKTKTVVDGDGFGLFGDLALGGSDVYGEVDVLTAPGNYTKFTPVAGPSVERNPYTLHLMAGWKKDATTEGTHSLNVESAFDLGSIKSGTPSATENTKLLTVNFFHGYILKAGNGYSVFLGDNSGFIWSADDIPGTDSDPDHWGLSVAPNLVFHKQLGKGFELTSGASASLSYNSFSNTSIVAPPAPAQTEASRLLTSNASVDLGLRWVKDNFAIEGRLSEALLQSGPNFISGSVIPMFAQVGVSLGI